MPRITVGPGTLVLGAVVGLFAWGTVSQSLPTGFAVAVCVTVGAGLIASVALHELGHALVAGACGGEVHEIAIFFMGGHTKYARGSIRPWQSFLVSAAGPAMNAGLALLFSFGAPVWNEGQRGGATLVTAAVGTLCLLMMLLNLGLAIFNVIPGLPLDGGRMLESLLVAVGVPAVRATMVAAWIGRAVAVALILGGLADIFFPGSNPLGIGALWTLIVAAVLFNGASEAITQATMTHKLETLDIRSLARPVRRYDPSAPLESELPFIERGGAYVDGNYRLIVPAREQFTPNNRHLIGDLPLSSAVTVDPALVDLPTGADTARILGTLAHTNSGGGVLRDAEGSIMGVVLAGDLTRMLREQRN